MLRISTQYASSFDVKPTAVMYLPAGHLANYGGWCLVGFNANTTVAWFMVTSIEHIKALPGPDGTVDPADAMWLALVERYRVEAYAEAVERFAFIHNR